MTGVGNKKEVDEKKVSRVDKYERQPWRERLEQKNEEATNPEGTHTHG